MVMSLQSDEAVCKNRSLVLLLKRIVRTDVLPQVNAQVHRRNPSWRRRFKITTHGNVHVILNKIAEVERNRLGLKIVDVGLNHITGVATTLIFD